MCYGENNVLPLILYGRENVMLLKNNPREKVCPTFVWLYNTHKKTKTKKNIDTDLLEHQILDYCFDCHRPEEV